MTDKAGVVFFVTLLRVTFGAVIHLHAIPGIEFIACDILAPDIDAVSSQNIGPVCGQVFGFVMVSVAGPALHLTHSYMGDMGEIDAIRLPVIRKPRDLFFVGHIFFQKIFLFGGFP